MITRADDYLIHQTPEPIVRVGTSNRNFYDRYFFNAYSRDGSVFFAAALGQYPNRQVTDAAFSVVHGGRQHVLRASCRAGPDRMESRVGPISVEVVEPLRQLRLVVEPNAWEISADVLFTARVPPLEEPRFHRQANGHTFMDYTRLTQHVGARGTVTVGKDTIRVEPEHYWGTRDRSWGIRPVGEPEPEVATGPPQFFWLWSPVNFEDLCTHFDVNEDADGERWHAAGMLAPAGGSVEVVPSVDYRLHYRPGTRHAQNAEVILRRGCGEELVIALRPLYNFYMVGLGYLHPQWGHGMYVGENEVSGESWSLAEVDPGVPLHLHVQAVCEASLGPRRGIGVLEQLVIGPHRPSGLSGLCDPAP